MKKTLADLLVTASLLNEPVIKKGRKFPSGLLFWLGKTLEDYTE
jgi:hypothetical protein